MANESMNTFEMYRRTLEGWDRASIRRLWCSGLMFNAVMKLGATIVTVSVLGSRSIQAEHRANSST